MASAKTARENQRDPGHFKQPEPNRIELSSPDADARIQTAPFRGKVLLVDDEPINSKVVVAILRKIGMEAEAVRTAAEALRMIERNDYSLVLMDIHMPEMSGFEAAEKIRAEEKKTSRRRMTIVAMTANDAKTTRRQCLAAGMDDFLTKPIHSEVLIERIMPLLHAANNPEKTQSLPPGASGPGATVPVGQLWSRSQALGFLDGDEALLRELAAVFVGRNDMLLENIATAMEQEDAEALQDAAHAYKGAVGHFASPVLRESAIALENMGKQRQFNGAALHFSRLLENSRMLCRDLQQLLIGAEGG